MDDPNLELIRRGYDLFERGDMEGFAALCDPAIEIRPILGALVGADVYRGRDGAQRWHADIADAMALGLELLEIERVGDERYFVTVRFLGRGRASGAQLDLVVGQVLTIRDHMLVRLEAYADLAAARAAAGLEQG